MLRDQTILCLAPDPWEGLWRNRHQIMTRLARLNTVLYVEPRLYLWEVLRRFRDGRLTLADLRAPLARHYAERLWIYHDPYYAPFSGRLSGGPLTAAWRRNAILATLRSLHAAAPILWLLRPYQADQIGRLGERLVVYHVTDDYSAHPTTGDRSAFLRAEEGLLRRADLVIVTSPGLFTSKGRFNPATYLVPNAVDYAGFQAALATGVRPPALAEGDNAIPHPRIGYAGALNEKVDFSLLAHVARAHSDWHLVLIGALDLVGQPDKATVLGGLPNVHWLGRLPVADLPGAIAGMDVCLLPYERNDWTANIDSLKLYEYLACGRPVVSVDVPAASRFGDVVQVAANPDEFVCRIEAALHEDTDASALRRKAVAGANTWEHRVARIEGLLGDALSDAGRRSQSAP